MAALREGSVYDVSVEARQLLVDGLEVPAVHARPDGMPTAGVVLHPDIGGLRPLFEDMARRLATHGLAVSVIEPWAFQPESVSWSSIEQRLAHVADLVDSQQMDMLAAAADLLVVEDDVARVSVLGFCMGGHYNAQGRVGRSLRRRGLVLRTDPHARSVAGTGAPHRAARGSRARCARRSRSSVRTTR